jgi:hydroxymethylpyrimidine pyrophosphatase-like HAD family hydrolase
MEASQAAKTSTIAAKQVLIYNTKAGQATKTITADEDSLERMCKRTLADAELFEKKRKADSPDFGPTDPDLNSIDKQFIDPEEDPEWIQTRKKYNQLRKNHHNNGLKVLKELSDDQQDLKEEFKKIKRDIEEDSFACAARFSGFDFRIKKIEKAMSTILYLFKAMPNPDLTIIEQPSSEEEEDSDLGRYDDGMRGLG